MNTDTCFPLQPFVSLNSEFFKAGQLGSGIIKKKILFQAVLPPGKVSQGLYGHLEMGTVGMSSTEKPFTLPMGMASGAEMAPWE